MANQNTQVLQADGPGRARSVNVTGFGGRTMQIAVYDLDWDTTNYTLDGESISNIWSDFKEVLFIGVSQKETTTDAENRLFAIDYTNKKIKVYTAPGTEQTAANIGFVAVRLFVVGIR
jgi:hypothetical protein